MAAQSRKSPNLKLVSNSEAKHPPSQPRCAYCVPAAKGSNDPADIADECLIKMLGQDERKQVSLLLYRLGREEGLFDQKCPMTRDKTYTHCPFYEDIVDIADES
ncbi:MAG: hypothetical protein BWY17_03285 [Deltaproteobacteria bacterium ADurb.Bin207]|jgi:hypothetical protein|nr:MAG: hypothetical protein BWY17_03285 [Deltaproteobacteria bacterium ADurb.Bin207]